ncbi:RBBP9/YdeN family alpha/beta hydrolase [Helicobacter canis]|uniref:RBBP9/YdeN family alpha/beta hydrolase n=1 Tax=Helicobacter canis TaxID=29419 RepID=UPI002942F6FA|nr:alpha/beta hydrolase [Helicobacter canis]
MKPTHADHSLISITSTNGHNVGVRIYIIHGFDSSPEKNWFQWLARELDERSICAKVLRLPTPENPNPNEWTQAIYEQVRADGEIDESVYFVAHSLGCIATLRFIETLDSCVRVGGTVLVAGFCEELPTLPELSLFVKSPLQSGKIKQIVCRRAVISARDDVIVPFSLSQNLAELIGADFIARDKGGHFMDSDGFRELPLVYDVLLAQIPPTCL